MGIPLSIDNMGTNIPPGSQYTLCIQDYEPKQRVEKLTINGNIVSSIGTHAPNSFYFDMNDVELLHSHMDTDGSTLVRLYFKSGRRMVMNATDDICAMLADMFMKLKLRKTEE